MENEAKIAKIAELFSMFPDSDEEEVDPDEDNSDFATAPPLSNPKIQKQLEQLKKFFDKKLFTEEVYNEKVRELLSSPS